jgi:hypothetical protein
LKDLSVAAVEGGIVTCKINFQNTMILRRNLVLSRLSRVKRVKVPFGEKRRSISGTVIDTDQFKQTKTGG